MKIALKGKNLYIVDKKSQQAEKVEVQGTVLMLQDKEGMVLEHGKLDLKQDLYVCLYCRKLKYISYIVNKGRVFAASFIMEDEEQFEMTLKIITEACPEMKLSEQNAKISAYAKSLVEKLQEGVAVTVIDTKKETDVKCCPVCGMQCDPNIPYCMECGASV